MLFKLLKELPQMFVIAAFIWVFVLILFIRNSRKKEKLFFTRHRSTLLAVVLALVLTVADIWLFITYIPTHFKKHPVAAASLSATDLLLDSSTNKADLIIAHAPVKIDSSVKPKSLVSDFSGKILLTNKASVRFLSHGSSEDIEATNHHVACSFDEKTGAIKFTGLIRGFEFENELMQEHFNDKDYMNSEAFPKTSFSGNVQNVSAINFAKDGTYPVTAKGVLTIHGVTKNITASGSLTVTGNTVSLKSIFKIKRIDFGINTDEIADELEITVVAVFN
jgi:polyisoprenoid-binding protein YceI